MQRIIGRTLSDAVLRSALLVVSQLLTLALLTTDTAGPARSSPLAVVTDPAPIVVSTSGHGDAPTLTALALPPSAPAPLWRAGAPGK